MSMRSVSASAALTALATTVLVGCTRPTTQGDGSIGAGIQIKGSDTMANVSQAWAEAFMAKTGIEVAVTGGGSGVGIASMLTGTCDIAQSSRPMEAEELDLAAGKGLSPQETIVGLDGIAVVVHPGNPVSELTVDQLGDIFTGKATNWEQVGGPDSEIVLLSREVNSGTHVYFKEHVLRRGEKTSTEEFAASALLQPSSQTIADEVAQNMQAIGYYGMGYLSPGQKAIAVAETEGGPYVKPLPENVVNGTYSISRPLLLYTNGEPTGDVKAYIDFILSPEGQKIVEEQDFVPVPAQEPADEPPVE